MEELIIRLHIQKQHRNRDEKIKDQEYVLKANLTETRSERKPRSSRGPQSQNNQNHGNQNPHLKPRKAIDKNKRKVVLCFACGKKGHFAKECRIERNKIRNPKLM